MKRYKFVCTLTPTQILGHLAFWALICVVTFGLAAPAFVYSFIVLVINATELIDQEAAAPVQSPPAMVPVSTGRQHVMPQPKLIIPKPLA